MRSGFIFSGFFWGLLLIFFGVCVLLKAFLNIDIPLLQLFLSFLFIYIGLRIIFGGFFWRGHFGPSHIGHQTLYYDPESKNNEFSISFGSGLIDLSNVSLEKETVDIKVSSSFSGCCVLLNPDSPAIIKVNSSFGGATFPDGNCLSFGNTTYKTKNFSKDSNHLSIEASVSFGSLRFVTSKDDADSFCNMDGRDWKSEKRYWRRYRKWHNH